MTAGLLRLLQLCQHDISVTSDALCNMCTQLSKAYAYAAHHDMQLASASVSPIPDAATS